VLDPDLDWGCPAITSDIRSGRVALGLLYRWVEHTSEAELEIEAESRADVLAEAATAFGDLFADAPRLEEVEVRVRATAADYPALFAAWLGELAYLAETDGFIPERAASLDLSGTLVKALVAGHRSEPQSLVKGVTYHRLEMAPHAGLWRARAVLDV
jgi:SHS2 domain-containing protein